MSCLFSVRRAPRSDDRPPEGPGGCAGEEECRAFCEDPANAAACFEFARDHDIPLKSMKPLLDYLGLKVQNCQLGCF